MASVVVDFHIVGGIAQGTAAFNFTHMLAIQARHAVEIIGGCLRRGVSTLEITREAEEAWLATMEARHVDHSHFYEECTPGFLNNEGKFRDRPTLYGSAFGGGPIEYQRLIDEWRAYGVEADAVIVFENGTVLDPAKRPVRPATLVGNCAPGAS